MPLVWRLRLRAAVLVGNGRGQKASSHLAVLCRSDTVASSAVVLTRAWAAKMATPPCLAADVVTMWSVPPFRPLRGAWPRGGRFAPQAAEAAAFGRRGVARVGGKVDPGVPRFLERQDGGLVRLLEVIAGGPVSFKCSDVEADDADSFAWVGTVTS